MKMTPAIVSLKLESLIIAFHNQTVLQNLSYVRLTCQSNIQQIPRSYQVHTNFKANSLIHFYPFPPCLMVNGRSDRESEVEMSCCIDETFLHNKHGNEKCNEFRSLIIKLACESPSPVPCFRVFQEKFLN